ncbi:hypothetical protein EBZ39_04215 [bacterium]|nr:hypothetical protein [bacterium]
MSNIYLSLTETPAVVTLSQPVIGSSVAASVTVANVVSVNVVTMPPISVSGGLTNAELRASAVTVALDANSLAALESVTVTVGNVTIGSSISVSNFPATQVVSVSNLPASQVVSISNFPSTQTISGTVTVGNSVTIAGTVTANPTGTQTIAGTVTANVFGYDASGAAIRQIPVAVCDDGVQAIDLAVPALVSNVSGAVNSLNPLSISGTVTANVIGTKTFIDNNAVTVSGFLTVGGWDDANSQYTPLRVNDGGSGVRAVPDPFDQNPFPISGTVTANSAQAVSIVNSTTITKADAKFNLIAGANNTSDFSTTYNITPLDIDIKGVAFVDGKTVSHRSSCVTNHPDLGTIAWQATLVKSTVTVGNSVTIGSLPVQLSTTTIGGTARLNVTLSSATTLGATVPSYGNLYGGSDGTNFRAINVDSSGRTVVTGSVSVANLPSTQTVAGTVTANSSNGTLTTRFGTPTTASTAFLTTAVTNTSRKYLLIQNVTTQSNVITVGVGFVPTTTQGIQLTAGAGITFESSYIPTGAVWVLSSVTASNYTILEA